MILFAIAGALIAFFSLVGGLAVFGGAKSAIHEIYGALVIITAMLGLLVTTVAAGAVSIRRAIENSEDSTPSRHSARLLRRCGRRPHPRRALAIQPRPGWLASGADKPRAGENRGMLRLAAGTGRQSGPFSVPGDGQTPPGFPGSFRVRAKTRTAAGKLRPRWRTPGWPHS